LAGRIHIKASLIATMITLVGLTLAACSSTPAATPVPATPVPPTPQVIEVPGDPGELVVYSGRSESLVGPIISQFQEVTGINVSVKYGGTGEIAATILEEGQNSPADVFFAQDPGGLGAVANAGMFRDLPGSLNDQVPSWAHSAENKWVGISGRARVVVYNTDNVSESDLPASLEGFTEPEWEGRLGWAPTNGSFQAMVTAMRVMWGDEKTSDWLTGIQDNNPTVFDGNTPVVAAVGAGEIDAGFVNHYYLHRFIAEEGEDFPARNYHPTAGGPGSLMMVAGAGILTTSDNTENAEKFLNFMLSTVAQQYFAGQTYEYPLVEGVNTSRNITPIDEINYPEIDMVSLEDLQGTQAMLLDLGILN
jgi:iron(III) transport system substrate-binding protein